MAYFLPCIGRFTTLAIVNILLCANVYAGCGVADALLPGALLPDRLFSPVVAVNLSPLCGAHVVDDDAPYPPTNGDIPLLFCVALNELGDGGRAAFSPPRCRMNAAYNVTCQATLNLLARFCVAVVFSVVPLCRARRVVTPTRPGHLRALIIAIPSRRPVPCGDGISVSSAVTVPVALGIAAPLPDGCKTQAYRLPRYSIAQRDGQGEPPVIPRLPAVAGLYGERNLHFNKLPLPASSSNACPEGPFR